MTPINYTDARQRAEAARKAIEAAQEEMSRSIRTAIEEGFQEIFDRYAFLGSVEWTQYTPYFNDGEPCVFSSHFTYPGINSVKDIEDGTNQHYEDGGEDFNRYENERRYLGYDRETYQSRYEPNDEHVPEYTACRQEILDFVKTLAGDERRDYSSTSPTTFDSAMLKAFGDHALITVKRSDAGPIVLEVDNYEHD